MKLAASFIVFAALSLCAAERDTIAQRGPLHLTMKRAIDIATSPEGNARIQLQFEAVKQAKSRANQARAALLPDVESFAGVSDAVRSLSTQGVDQVKLPFTIIIPSRVGPYATLDLRVTAAGNVFDYASIRRYQSARSGIKGAQLDVDTVDDQVVGLVSRAYLTALRADAEVDAANADIELAQGVLKQSQNQKEAGSGTGIDVTRSQVQLANEKQRMLVAKNNQLKAHLQLLRAMNLRLDTELVLTDKLTYKPVDSMTADDAITQARASRPDLQSQLRREDTTRLNASSIKFERLPSIVAQTDYGTTGTQDVNILPTYTLTAGVRVPIFDGGRRDARRAEAYSQLRQEKIRSAELRDSIELDVRTALDSIHSADEQVDVAQSGLKLAETELAQARRRFDAGVAIGLEVTDASDRLERARTNQIAAIYNHNLARIDLGQALGKTRIFAE